MASAADIAKSLLSVFGTNDEESTVSCYLDTGYCELNYALASRWDGGLPVGRIVELAGPPSSGKTAVATAAMAAAQKAGGIAGFCDHERSFSLTLAPRLGLDVTPGRFLFKKPRTFEESIALCVAAAGHIRKNKLIKPDAPICWVFDSLASMVPMSAFFDAKTGEEKTPDKRSMNDNTALARATSAHMPAFAMHCEELGICAIFLNQTRLKLGVMYGDPTTTPGGEAPKFYASQRIMLSSAKISKKGESNDVLGSQITARIIKNKVARPFLTATWRFVFNADGTGKFDAVRSTIDFLIKEKIMANPGGRITWTDGKTYFADPLAAKIEKEGLHKDLYAMLPKRYEPEVVVMLDDEPDAEAA